MMKIINALLVLAAVGFSFTKTKGFIPPGTVQINDTLFADETEISNGMWQEYELWTKSIYGANSKEHLATLPDTLVWREKLSNNEPYVVYYYRHPGYKNHPVVGVSFEQAQAYCKWRTDRVKSMLTLAKKFKYQDFAYRLPAKEEWEKLAEYSNNVLNNSGKDEKGNYQLNCKRTEVVNGPPYPDVTVPVQSYEKSRVGLYNMLGNVAEMVLDQGICKGGAWNHIPEQCRVGVDRTYTKPTAWLGFRCVCIIKKTNT